MFGSRWAPEQVSLKATGDIGARLWAWVKRLSRSSSSRAINEKASHLSNMSKFILHLRIYIYYIHLELPLLTFFVISNDQLFEQNYSDSRRFG